jgi:hypothetical protein
VSVSWLVHSSTHSPNLSHQPSTAPNNASIAGPSGAPKPWSSSWEWNLSGGVIISSATASRYICWTVCRTGLGHFNPPLCFKHFRPKDLPGEHYRINRMGGSSLDAEGLRPER